ncbi:MAG: hypothetical protein EPO02_02450 [Nitrospirae bacterium]|nr:MAG: hypothetical protein EPO02_02450 [Nitrospirota bacterium]
MALFADSMTVRTILGVALLVLVSLFSTVKLTKPADQFVYKFTGITEIVPDDVTRYETRFAKLRALLPRRGTVGYVTDKEGPGDLAAHEKYLYVAYTMAPVLVEYGPRHALVVGNITQPATDLQQFLQAKHLALLKNLGDGVLLLQGPER